VELRNRRLVDFAAETIGTYTSYVYGTVLKLLAKKIPRCHDDPRMDIGDMPDEDVGPRVVTTMEILNSLPTSIDVSLGIAKIAKERVDKYSAQAVNPNPPSTDKLAAILNGDNGDNDDDGSESDEDYAEPNGHHADDDMDDDAKPAVNGNNDSKVRFSEPKESRVDMLRQHLYLLAENGTNFVRHCGQDQWTVDFGPLIQHLKEAELDTVIERTVGRQGLRLVRILRKKGKLDEKSLPTVALMKKSDVQTKMLEMETAGFVDIQEVPRDASRTANRTIFLWYTQTERCFDQLLDRTYTTMVRCLQRLAAERRKEKDVLLLTKRTDVKGREKEMMQEGYYKRFAAFLEVERKLLGQVMRCDELVAVLRDY
jgi:DNA-directed RNA polymerase III subunit RPC3